MSYVNTPRFSIAAFAIAMVMAISLNGAVVVGFDHLASAGAQGTAEAAQMVAATSEAKHVTLEPVVISARRAKSQTRG